MTILAHKLKTPVFAFNYSTTNIARSAVLFSTSLKARPAAIVPPAAVTDFISEKGLQRQYLVLLWALCL